MKEYLLRQPKATCVLFSIACKINLGLVKNNRNPGGRGGLWPWKSGWVGGSQWSRKSRWEGGSKNVAIRRGCVDFFWNNPITKKGLLFMLKRFILKDLKRFILKVKLYKIRGVFFFILSISCWNIWFGAISNFRWTISVSSRENLRNGVHLFCHLWIFEMILCFSLGRFRRFRKRRPSIPIISSIAVFSNEANQIFKTKRCPST